MVRELSEDRKEPYFLAGDEVSVFDPGNEAATLPVVRPGRRVFVVGIVDGAGNIVARVEMRFEFGAFDSPHRASGSVHGPLR